MDEIITLSDLQIAYDLADTHYWNIYFSQSSLSDIASLAEDRHDAAFNYLYWAKSFGCLEKVEDIKKIYKILTKHSLDIISKRQRTKDKNIRIKLGKPVFI